MAESKTCPQFRQEVLVAYAVGCLDPAQSGAVKAHRACCPDCDSFLSAQALVWEALDLWEPPGAPDSFNREVWRRIVESESAPWYRRLAETLRSGAWKPVVPLAAAVALVAVGFVFDHRTSVPSQPVAGSGWGVSASEADQLESTLEDIQLLRLLE